MKKIFIALFLMSSFFVSAQSVDTIIKNSVYKSYYSFKYKNPLYVKYKLYKGGGDCNRSQFAFKVDDIKNTATIHDYANSGYDKGHMANAEDFAYDCVKMGLTFKFYNCIPQTPKLNRGIWKSYESKARKLSQTDSLEIICGGIYEDRHLPNSDVTLPTYCWKIIKSLSTGKIIYALLFTNEMEENSVKNMPVEELQKKIGYKPEY